MKISNDRRSTCYGFFFEKNFYSFLSTTDVRFAVTVVVRVRDSENIDGRSSGFLIIFYTDLRRLHLCAEYALETIRDRRRSFYPFAEQ